MTKFREKGKVTTFVNRVKPTEAAKIFTRKQERGRKGLFTFIYFIFMSNREISICMVSPFFNTDIFQSFYPQDYIYILFIKLIFIGY